MTLRKLCEVWRARISSTSGTRALLWPIISELSGVRMMLDALPIESLSVRPLSFGKMMASSEGLLLRPPPLE